MKHLLIGILLTVLPSLYSCKGVDEYTTNSRENFEALWKILDENYCFFSYKEVDWNEVYDRYSVQISDTMSQYALFDVLADMLAELKDGHTNLYSSFDVARYWDWYQDYPANFYEELNEEYLGKDYKIAGGLEYKKMADDQIGYVRYSSFSSGISESNLDYMFYYFKDCKGLIIDIRNNGGGALNYAERFASRFIEETTLVGYMQHKTGKGHDDFSEPYPIELEPSAYIRWLRPTIVLTNRHCYSAANDFGAGRAFLERVNHFAVLRAPSGIVVIDLVNTDMQNDNIVISARYFVDDIPGTAGGFFIKNGINI